MSFKEKLKRQGFSLKIAAKRIGTSQEYLSQVNTHRSVPSPKMVLKIMRAFPGLFRIEDINPDLATILQEISILESPAQSGESGWFPLSAILAAAKGRCNLDR